MNNSSAEFEYMQLNPKNIFIDPDYQRQLDITRVRRIVANFNPDLVNPVKINYRDGKYYCFDGQHTLSALKMKFGGGDLMVGCKVYRGQSKEWEAKMFAEQNGLARQVKNTSKFKALYAAGDIDIVEFHTVTNGTGIRMDFTEGSAKNKISACTTAYKIFKSLGAAEYVDILMMLKEAYNGDADCFSNQILLGMADFHRTYKGEYKRPLLISQLEKVSPKEIIREASLYRNEGLRRYCNQILRIYNKNTRSSRLEPKGNETAAHGESK